MYLNILPTISFKHFIEHLLLTPAIFLLSSISSNTLLTFNSFLHTMGNYVSCTLSGPAGKQSRGVKVISPSGQIQRFYQPVKAAELMLDTPGYFLNNAKSLQIGKRFSPLHADEDLEICNVYVLIPMKKVNSVVVAADLGTFFLKARRTSSFGRVRISPECGNDESPVDRRSTAVETTVEEWFPKLTLDEFEEFSSPEFKHRLSVCRSKKPALETIVEEPYFNRC